VAQARRNVPTNTGEFATRIAALKARIDALGTRLAATEQSQADYLAHVAVTELEDQKARLATYQIQARFALAGMYDRAAHAGAAPAKAPAAQQKGAEEEPSETPPPQGPAPQTPAPEARAPEAPSPEAPPPAASPAAPNAPAPQNPEPPR
jgi:hypothetical protein